HTGVVPRAGRRRKRLGGRLLAERRLRLIRAAAAAVAVAVAALAVAAVAVSAVGAVRLRVFTTNDPLTPKQWYLPQDHAFDFWLGPPVLPPVRVAIIDSGIDAGHPEFAGRIAAARSFVGGSAADSDGHGTFIAGEIAAVMNNSEGIAGIAFNAQLLVAK